MNYSKVELYCLTGTPKTKTGLMPVRQVDHRIKATSFLKHLTRERPVTTAGDDGSITVWWDPTCKVWRGERHRFHSCVDSIELPSRTMGLRIWVDKTLKANRG